MSDLQNTVCPKCMLSYLHGGTDGCPRCERDALRAQLAASQQQLQRTAEADVVERESLRASLAASEEEVGRWKTERDKALGELATERRHRLGLARERDEEIGKRMDTEKERNAARDLAVRMETERNHLAAECEQMRMVRDAMMTERDANVEAREKAEDEAGRLKDLLASHERAGLRLESERDSARDGERRMRALFDEARDLLRFYVATDEDGGDQDEAWGRLREMFDAAPAPTPEAPTCKTCMRDVCLHEDGKACEGDRRITADECPTCKELQEWEYHDHAPTPEAKGAPLCPDCANRGDCHTANLDRYNDYDFAHCKMFKVIPTPEAKGCAECERLVTVLRKLSSGETRQSIHAAFNGGHFGKEGQAFHHGINTAMNCVDHDVGNALAGNTPPTPPPTPAAETGEVERVARVLMHHRCGQVGQDTCVCWALALEGERNSARSAARAVLSSLPSRSAIRNEALEEAAIAVDALGDDRWVERCVEAIRALKVKP